MKFSNLKRKILDCSIPAAQQPDRKNICAVLGQARLARASTPSSDSCLLLNNDVDVDVMMTVN